MVDEYIPPKLAQEREPMFDFESAKPGTSIWVETNSRRMYALKKFKEWAAKNNPNISATSVEVGDEDPRGPGYRLVFKAEPLKLNPTARAVIRTRAAYLQFAPIGGEYRMSRCGIFTEEDVEKAIASTGIRPNATITEAKAVDKMIYRTCSTPYQVAWMEANDAFVNEFGHPVFREEWERQKNSFKAPPPKQWGPQRRSIDVVLPSLEAHRVRWIDLTDDEVAEARLEGITTEAQWNEAMSYYAPFADAKMAQTWKRGIIEGRSAWHSARVQQAAREANARPDILPDFDD